MWGQHQRECYTVRGNKEIDLETGEVLQNTCPIQAMDALPADLV